MTRIEQVLSAWQAAFGRIPQIGHEDVDGDSEYFNIEGVFLARYIEGWLVGHEIVCYSFRWDQPDDFDIVDDSTWSKFEEALARAVRLAKDAEDLRIYDTVIDYSVDF